MTAWFPNEHFWTEPFFALFGPLCCLMEPYTLEPIWFSTVVLPVPEPRSKAPARRF
jgi:hypothetical protein